MKALKLEDRGSPVPFENRNRIYKSKSGHSISQTSKHQNGFKACENLSLETSYSRAEKFLPSLLDYKTSDNSDNQSSENEL
jgi:hypothetical protein